MICVVVRELTYLKLLYPIIREFIRNGTQYVLYYMNNDKGEKNYNRPTVSAIKNTSKDIINRAKKVQSFTNDKQLLKFLIEDKITKLVSLEIWLWGKSYLSALKKHNIKTYSILYLTDSIWRGKQSIIHMDRLYYASKHTMSLHHEFSGVKFNPKRDRLLGSPIFDPISNSLLKGNNILILLPNIKKEHIKVSFGSSENFIKIIEKLSKGGDLILKTRKKQWLPKEIKKYAKEIVDDGDKMYPSVITKLLKRCYTTVLFYSSGVYEAVFGDNYVLNIPLPLKRWSWNKTYMGQYFSIKEGNLYQFQGVVESIDQKTILQDNWEFKPKIVDAERREQWIKKYIGDITNNSAKLIAQDITPLNMV